jgi:hypothetical protein
MTPLLVPHMFESWTLRREVQVAYLRMGTFIETGSYHGGGIQQAIELGFQQIYSIELDEILYRNCAERFSHLPNVRCLLGDSRTVLADLIKAQVTPAFVFLDGHSEDNCPLLVELEILSRSNIKHTICIDDIDMILNGWSWGKMIPLQSLYEAIALLPAYRLRVLDSKKRARSQWLLEPAVESASSNGV